MKTNQTLIWKKSIVFGEWLRAERLKRDLTLQEMADLTNISKSLIWEIENKGPDLRFGTMIKISSGLGLKLSTAIKRSGL